MCAVKPHVLRYWEQEFAQLRPTKRRGNRRYYQLHEVQLIRRIRELLYEQGFTIVGARNKLLDRVLGEADEMVMTGTLQKEATPLASADGGAFQAPSQLEDAGTLAEHPVEKSGQLGVGTSRPLLHQVRDELLDIRNLLGPFA